MSVRMCRPPGPARRPRTGRGLHDEIRRLPVVFRLPVVLCYFEGLTLGEAAGELQCPDGTVGSRLARAHARKLLAASPAAASSCPPPCWPRHSPPDRPRHRSHRPCATSRLGPRSHSRPDRPRRRGPIGPGDSPCPGGAKIHVPPQGEVPRDGLPVHGRGRRRRGTLPRIGSTCCADGSGEPVRQAGS